MFSRLKCSTVLKSVKHTKGCFRNWYHPAGVPSFIEALVDNQVMADYIIMQQGLGKQIQI